MLAAVDLPLPDSPTSETVVPRWISKLTPFRALISLVVPFADRSL